MKCKSNYVACDKEAEIGLLCRSCLVIEYQKKEEAEAERIKKGLLSLPGPKNVEVKDWRPENWDANSPPVQRGTDENIA